MRRVAMLTGGRAWALPVGVAGLLAAALVWWWAGRPGGADSAPESAATIGSSIPRTTVVAPPLAGNDSSVQSDYAHRFAAEAYAEGFASYFGGNPAFITQTPSQYSYWAGREGD